MNTRSKGRFVSKRYFGVFIFADNTVHLIFVPLLNKLKFISSRQSLGVIYTIFSYNFHAVPDYTCNIIIQYTIRNDSGVKISRSLQHENMQSLKLKTKA